MKKVRRKELQNAVLGDQLKNLHKLSQNELEILRKVIDSKKINDKKEKGNKRPSFFELLLIIKAIVEIFSQIQF